jgi:hypothetical protein
MKQRLHACYTGPCQTPERTEYEKQNITSMSAQSIISTPLAMCIAGQQQMTPMGTSAVFRAKSLQRSTCSTLEALDGVHPPFQASSSCNPPSQQMIHRRSCFKAGKKTKEAAAANPVLALVHHRRLITFDEVVRVRTVSCTTCCTRADRLWYQPSDYGRFRTKIGKLAILAKKYQQEHGKSVHWPGMEKFSDIAGTDTYSAAQRRSLAIGSVLLEQFCQRQQGCINQERISALYKLKTLQAQELAWERAAVLRVSHNHDDCEENDDE